MNEIIEFLNEVLGVDNIDEDSSMLNTPLWDSVAHIEMCLAFEQRFDIKMSISDIGEATSVKALVALRNIS